MASKDSVLLILTGGTISMAENPDTQSLSPLSNEMVLSYIPELKKLNVNISSVSFTPLIDSSDISPMSWVKLAEIISTHYNDFDGFVVLHGTDTMSYSASALSFMLQNLAKPVIFTGAQLPIGILRSDAKENLLTAIELAACKINGQARVPEVCIYFEDSLMRGNRTSKKNAEHFNAFESFNYPILAKSGVHIKFDDYVIAKPSNLPLRVFTKLDANIAILKLFPGMTPHYVKALLSTPNLRAVIIESFGSGNAPSDIWFFELLNEASQNGIVILNISQCRTGSVEMGRYATSLNLMKAGVVSGYDMTSEAAVAKLMYLLGNYSSTDEIKQKLTQSLCGEVTINDSL